MNAATVVVFEDWVYGTTAVYTSHGLNELLSSCSNLTIQAIVSQAGGTLPTITIVKETASDERSFQPVTTLISGAALTAGTTNVVVGTGHDATARATRLNISLGGTGSPVAHVRVLATLRTEFG